MRIAARVTPPRHWVQAAQATLKYTWLKGGYCRELLLQLLLPDTGYRQHKQRSNIHCYREDTDENSCSSHSSQTLDIGSTSNAQIYNVKGRILMRIAAPATPPKHWV